MFLFFGLLVVIKTITRDYSQGTIQLYMNKVKNRVGYVIAKTISIIIFRSYLHLSRMLHF